MAISRRWLGPSAVSPFLIQRSADFFPGLPTLDSSLETLRVGGAPRLGPVPKRPVFPCGARGPMQFHLQSFGEAGGAPHGERSG